MDTASTLTTSVASVNGISSDASNYYTSISTTPSYAYYSDMGSVVSRYATKDDLDMVYSRLYDEAKSPVAYMTVDEVKSYWKVVKRGELPTQKKALREILTNVLMDEEFILDNIDLIDPSSYPPIYRNKIRTEYDAVNLFYKAKNIEI